jgi:hypothetical protein
MPQEDTRRALIVVRTYPVPSVLGIESSCTAAVTESGEWLRLFPVPWRLLRKDQQFRKYEWIEAHIAKASDDSRLESYRLKQDGLRVLSAPLSTADGWRARKEIVFPLMSHCLCYLVKQRDEHQYPTLGLIRPASITRLRISPAEPRDWTESELAMLRQQHLFVEAPKQELEKVPFVFRYEFRCPEETCSGHTLMCTDWEMSQAYRKWKTEYGDGWQDKFRQRFEREMMDKKDTHFFVGTVASHPNRWIIIGLFYPPRPMETGQTALF